MHLALGGLENRKLPGNTTPWPGKHPFPAEVKGIIAFGCGYRCLPCFEHTSVILGSHALMDGGGGGGGGAHADPLYHAKQNRAAPLQELPEGTR